VGRFFYLELLLSDKFSATIIVSFNVISSIFKGDLTISLGVADNYFFCDKVTLFKDDFSFYYGSLLD